MIRIEKEKKVINRRLYTCHDISGYERHLHMPYRDVNQFEIMLCRWICTPKFTGGILIRFLSQRVAQVVVSQSSLKFRTEPELHDSIPRFQFVFAFPTHQSLNRSGLAAQSGSEMNRSGSLRTYSLKLLSLTKN